MAEYNAATHGDMDIIFVGGGTSACVAAGRLAASHTHLKILLIEGGRNNFEDPTVRNPAAFLTHLAPDSQSAIVCPKYSYTCSLFMPPWI
jgi:alcohol oxidase